MPYIAPDRRPAIDQAVEVLAAELAAELAENRETSRLSVRLRDAFHRIGACLRRAEEGADGAPNDAAARLADCIVQTASGSGMPAGWTGELNYALTRLIQAVPLQMCRLGAWDEPLRYWIYAQIVGALTRTAWTLHAECADDPVGNGLCGVLIDVKDEYKRRVNTAYEAAQILKSGDCYDKVPYRTELVSTDTGGVHGYQEVMLPKQELAPGGHAGSATSRP